MNNINNYKPGKYLNLNSPNYKEMDKNKNISAKNFNYNKIPLIQPNKKITGEFSFSLAQNDKSSNNRSLFPIKKIIVHKSNNPLSIIESKYNYNQNKDNSDYINNNFNNLDISANKQIHYINNIFSLFN